jgi:hypothetical protein
MDSTPVMVDRSALTGLSAGLDGTGETLSHTPAAAGSADATALALGLVAGDLVALLLRLAAENRRAVAEAGAAVRLVADATGSAATGYGATDDTAARRLRDAGALA